MAYLSNQANSVNLSVSYGSDPTGVLRGCMTGKPSAECGTSTLPGYPPTLGTTRQFFLMLSVLSTSVVATWKTCPPFADDKAAHPCFAQGHPALTIVTLSVG